MKEFVIGLSRTDFNDDWQVQQIQKKANWFLVKDIPNKFDSADIDKNFYSLCSLMEENGSSSPTSYSVIQFYSKLDYINKKIERENEAYEASKSGGSKK
jgi:hypothetical protein